MKFKPREQPQTRKPKGQKLTGSQTVSPVLQNLNNRKELLDPWFLSKLGKGNPFHLPTNTAPKPASSTAHRITPATIRTAQTTPTSPAAQIAQPASPVPGVKELAHTAESKPDPSETPQHVAGSASNSDELVRILPGVVLGALELNITADISDPTFPEESIAPEQSSLQGLATMIDREPAPNAHASNSTIVVLPPDLDSH